MRTNHKPRLTREELHHRYGLVYWDKTTSPLGVETSANVEPACESSEIEKSEKQKEKE